MRPEAHFGALLRRLRQKADLTQEACAELVGCATQTLRAFEHGRRRPSLDMVERIADVLQIPSTERSAFIRMARSGRSQADAEQPAIAPAPPAPIKYMPPAEVWTLIGRAAELQAIKAHIANPAIRLLTITGTGGIGKSRLARQIAQDLAPGFADGAVVVLLAGAESGAAALSTIAASLQIPLQGRTPIAAQIVDALRPLQRLLLLDNLEHLLEGQEIPELIAAILSAAPGVRLLATSRERLRLSGEWIFELDGLSIPADPDGLEAQHSDAALLFVARARQQQSDLTLGSNNQRAISRICRLLEGNPLALELAAAWVAVLSCDEIAAEIAHDLDFLNLADRDRPGAHRNMRVVFDHSWSLLSTAEQEILARLSVFRGGFSREAATFVTKAGLPHLAALMRKSLLRRSGERYDLHAIIRHYAAERFSTYPDATATMQRFIDFYLAQSAQGSQEFAESGRRAIYDSLLLEIDNLRAALQQAQNARNAEQAARLCAALRVFWGLHGLFSEGVRWTERTLALGRLPDALRGDLYNTISSLVWHLGDIARAKTTAEQAITIHRASGDPEGLALALSCLARTTLVHGNYQHAQVLYEECVTLRRKVMAAHVLAWGLALLGLSRMLNGAMDEARRHFDEALTLSRQNADRFTEGGTLNYLALGLTLARDPQGAALAAEALRLLSNPAYLPGMVISFEILAAQAGLRQRHIQAARIAGAAQNMRQRLNSPATAINRADYDQLFEIARGACDDEHWARALVEGRALPLQQAIELALAEAN